MSQNRTDSLKKEFSMEILEMFKNIRRTFGKRLDKEGEFIPKAKEKLNISSETFSSNYDVHDEIFKTMYRSDSNDKDKAENLISILKETGYSDLACLLKSYPVFKPHFLLLIIDEKQDKKEVDELSKLFESMKFTVVVKTVNELENDIKNKCGIDTDGIFLLFILFQIDRKETELSVGKIIEHFCPKNTPKLFLINSERVTSESKKNNSSNNDDANNNPGNTSQTGKSCSTRSGEQTDNTDGSTKKENSEKNSGETECCEKDDLFVVRIFYEDNSQSFVKFLVQVFQNYAKNEENKQFYRFEHMLCDINRNLNQGMVSACWIPKKHLIFYER